MHASASRPHGEPIYRTAAFSPPLDEWSAVIRIEFAAGQAVDWEPLQFVFQAPEREPVAYEPSVLQQTAPALLDQLCFYSEMWFQASLPERHV